MPAETAPADDAPRLLHDPLVSRPVFLAPARDGRPDDARLAAGSGGVDDPRGWCPFCAGNEARTPPAVARTPADESLPWRARIVPNRFPFATDSGQSAAAAVGTAACGVHDVVIEAPGHERSILALEAGAWRDVWATVRARLAALAAHDDVAWTTVFKNSGAQAGASLEHLHSQIVGLDFVPPIPAAELAAAGPGTFAALLAAARADGRVVAEADGLVALVPPAPRQPLECWILPADPQPFLHAAPPAHVAALADLTRLVVARLDRTAPGAHYNWWLHQFPSSPPPGACCPAADWHWHLEIVPRLARLAGFELGTGCHVTTVAPVEAARLLREH